MNTNILLLGEAGTGKTKFAKYAAIAKVKDDYVPTSKTTLYTVNNDSGKFNLWEVKPSNSIPSDVYFKGCFAFYTQDSDMQKTDQQILQVKKRFFIPENKIVAVWILDKNNFLISKELHDIYSRGGKYTYFLINLNGYSTEPLFKYINA